MARPRKNAAKAQGSLLTLDEATVIPVEEQPYPLPEGWKWVRLGKLYQINPRIIADDNTMASFVPMEKIEPGMKGTFTFEILPWGKAKKGHTQFADGDVAFAKISPCFENGKFMLVRGLKNGIGAGTTELIILRQPSVLQKYTFYLICSSDFIQKGTHTYSGTVGQQRISMDFIRNYPVPLPPLDHQQRIVDRIESLFAKLDEAREKAEAVLDGFESRKVAILHKAFTGELTANWREEKGVALTDWKNLTLNDIAEYRKGPFGSSITKAMFVPKGKDTYKVYEQGNAIRKTLSYGTYYISKEKFNELSSFCVGEGDIIISCAGTIGEIYKLPYGSEQGVINQALMRVRVYSNTDEKFFEYYFSGILKSDVIDKANGTAIKNIPPFKVMKAMPIHLPLLSEQREIVRTLDGLLAKEQQAKESAQTMLEQIDLMKKAILARAFRGALTGPVT